MMVKVTSHLFGKEHLTGTYEIESSTAIKTFLTGLEVGWDYDALIVVNKVIIDETYVLQAEDDILLLTPIYGG